VQVWLLPLWSLVLCTLLLLLLLLLLRMITSARWAVQRTLLLLLLLVVVLLRRPQAVPQPAVGGLAPCLLLLPVHNRTSR
jgi:hypothetical protein